MNEHNDTTNSDDDISKLYAQASTEQPPLHIDDAILAAAQTLIKDKPSATIAFSRRWAVPVSIAAVIIMSVSLVTLIQHEIPEELTSLPESVLSQAAPKKPALTNSEAKESLLARMREDSAAIALKDKQPIALARKPAASKRSEKIVSSPSPKTLVAAEEEIAFTESLAPLEPQADTPQVASVDISATPRKEKPKRKFAPRQMENKAAMAAFMATAPTPSCESLPISDCLVSLQCTLTTKDKGYICRKARNHCEQDFSQKTGTAEQCTTKPNCQFIPGKCFCPPDVICVCGGGPPRMCVPG